jgi:endonuclease/exonuclease/phosphatase family metal-dependent hydrolase
MRLMTYNIHKGVGTDRRYRLGRVAEAIAAEGADLVCLQEVDRNVRRSNYDDQPALLAEALPFAASAYQLNVPRKEGGYGNLILSRWPIRSTCDVSLQYRRRRKRAALLAVVETPEGPLHLVNLHLGLTERERRWQAAHLLAHPLFRQAAALPAVVVGDFNDWRNALSKLFFRPEGFHQATAPASHYRSFPAYLPLASLDKVFYRGAVTPERAHVVRRHRLRRASDHLPVTFDFHLRPGEWPA